MTSIASVRNAIQTVNATVSGITSAPIAHPASLNAADLPAALVFVGAGEMNEQAIGLRRWTRTFITQVYVMPVAQGDTVWTGYDDAMALLDAVVGAYHAQNSASGGLFSGLVDHVEMITDDGIGRLAYAGVDYHGFVVRLRVVVKD